ncbi:Cadherin-13 [Labeo rohita]|uniref:Cadherin-13 n=1 Tax=Labeo rohita TaxID=84645 RepID=A0ABQ8LS32_LABRO|nr:Cadherin-13 [Labeo rohita]
MDFGAFIQSHVISSDMKEDHIFRLTGKGADQDPKGVFSINRLTGEVAVSRALDREAIAYYHPASGSVKESRLPYRMWDSS